MPGAVVLDLLNQLRQRAKAVRVVNGDVVRSSLENAVVLEAPKGLRQDLRGGAALGGDEVAGLRQLNSIARLELVPKEMGVPGRAQSSYSRVAPQPNKEIVAFSEDEQSRTVLTRGIEGAREEMIGVVIRISSQLAPMH